ncbi:MAG: hypothetical protein ACREOH_08825, partial [Candidatus Entotheonellia bacterium]
MTDGMPSHRHDPIHFLPNTPAAQGMLAAPASLLNALEWTGMLGIGRRICHGLVCDRARLTP